MSGVTGHGGFIPAEELAEVAAKAADLRDQEKTHMEVCEALNDVGFRTRTGRLWRHPQQIVKLLRSFAPTQRADD